MIEVLIGVIAFVALAAASYCDLRTKEVPDWISYGLLFSVLGIELIASILSDNWWIIESGVLGFTILFLIGYLLYKLGQWGGGDTKLLMGLGAAIGIDLPFQASSWELLFFFFALLFCGAVYGLGWVVYLAVIRRKIVFHKFREELQDYRLLHLILAGTTILIIVLAIIQRMFLPFVFFPLPFFYFFLLLGIVEKHCFYRSISVEKLTEGDWLAKEVKVKGKIILEHKTLEKNDLLKLNKLYKSSLLKEVMIKEGIPFVPCFLLAYILLMFRTGIWNWMKF
ncbi:prepilin peptidase [Candidatus Woesearchaeota archaeon]|nr:prepilin peptidase [Candidatus Woesearchaeota archaeon]